MCVSECAVCFVITVASRALNRAQRVFCARDFLIVPKFLIKNVAV